MKIDFKTLGMMELRSAPGEILDRVARDGDVFVVERNGQPKACLVPVSFLLPDISPDRIADELASLSKHKEDYRLTINESKELEITCRAAGTESDMLISIVLPHGYPSAAPRIYALTIPADAPMRWPDGSLSIYGSSTAWNSKSQNVVHALGMARLWLKHFYAWQRTGLWPEQGVTNE